MIDYTQKRIERVEDLPASLRSRAGWAELFELQRPSEPHIHQIEPTNHCPYQCIMCPRSTKMTRELGFMDMALFQSVIDEIATFSSRVRSLPIELFHFGESLLHPELPEMVRYGALHDLDMVLSVNAPQLHPELACRVLDAGPRKIIISLDGHDDESYRTIRGSAANYRKAVDHISFLLNERTRTQNAETEIIIRMILMKENRSQAEPFRQYWEAKGATVELRTFFPWTEPELQEIGAFHRYPPFMVCPFPWQYMVIQWDGTVVPCCRDYNGENRIGSVTEKSLKEIWNSTNSMDFRNRHEKGAHGTSSLCSRCMDIYYTEG